MPKRTKVFIFSSNATKEQWDEISTDLTNLSAEEFKEKHSFSKSGIRPYYNEYVNGLTGCKKNVNIPYIAPVNGYEKITIHLSSDTKEHLTQILDQLENQTGLQRRYLTSWIIEQGISQLF